MSTTDVIRTCEAGERLDRALQSLTSSPDGGAKELKSLLTDGGECTAAARRAAFDALVATSSAESAAVIHFFALSSAPHGLDLYGAARKLPTVALLTPELNASEAAEVASGAVEIEAVRRAAQREAAEAFAEADLGTVGELVRYCSEDEDIAAHVGALALELAEVGLDRGQITALVSAARSLCEATAKLPKGGGGDGSALGGRVADGAVDYQIPMATIHAWQTLEGELSVRDEGMAGFMDALEGAQESSLSAALDALEGELGATDGGLASSLASLSAAALRDDGFFDGLAGGLSGALGGGMGAPVDVADLRDIDADEEHEDGPLPGTKSFGC